MPGGIWFPFREGNRSEYLALYILSALGVAIYVPRTEDIGVDFYCSLAKREGKRLTFHSPFIVQVKSSSVKKIEFGGPDKKNEKWKKKEIDWLFSQELPLLIGSVDKKKPLLKLYSTSNMWAAHYMDSGIGQVVLELDRPKGENHVFAPPKAELCERWPSGIGNGKRARVPLGQALVAISLDDLQKEARLETYRKILSYAIHMEQKNITYRRLKVHFSQWPHRFQTNEGIEAIAVNMVANPRLGTNTDAQLESIKPIIATLAFNYKSQGKWSELMSLKPIVQLLKPDYVLEMLGKKVPELFE